MPYGVASVWYASKALRQAFVACWVLGLTQFSQRATVARVYDLPPGKS